MPARSGQSVSRALPLQSVTRRRPASENLRWDRATTFAVFALKHFSWQGCSVRVLWRGIAGQIPLAVDVRFVTASLRLDSAQQQNLMQGVL